MNTQTSKLHTSFALSAALKNLSTNTFHFVLRIAERADFQMLVDFVPLGTSIENSRPVTRYRKSISTVIKGKQRAGLSSTVTVDLSKGTFLDVDVPGLDSVVQNSVALPVTAQLGESGKYFEHLLTSNLNAAASEIASASPKIASPVGWSLEALDDATALWCTNIYALNGVDIENSECLKINQLGEILGFSIRSWAQVPVTGGEQERRLVILKSY
jgi:hypothetical protein